MFFLSMAKTEIMDKGEFNRNNPSDKGRDNDPNIRDESAAQPGVNTMSSARNDEANQHLTRTAADNFDESNSDADADTRFNEVEDKS
jgi:hypothetical protein